MKTATATIKRLFVCWLLQCGCALKAHEIQADSAKRRFDQEIVTASLILRLMTIFTQEDQERNLIGMAITAISQATFLFNIKLVDHLSDVYARCLHSIKERPLLKAAVQQHEVDEHAMFIDCAEQILPLAAHLDVRLIDAAGC